MRWTGVSQANSSSVQTCYFHCLCRNTNYYNQDSVQNLVDTWLYSTGKHPEESLFFYALLCLKVSPAWLTGGSSQRTMVQNNSIFCQLNEEEFFFFHAQQDLAQSPGLWSGGAGTLPARPGRRRRSPPATSLYFPRLLQYPTAAPAAYLQNPWCTSASPSLMHHPKCLLILGPPTASSTQHHRHCLLPIINCLNA